jgi:hypothetical protein
VNVNTIALDIFDILRVPTRARFFVACIVSRVAPDTVHVPMSFGPEYFARIVGSPVCADCEVAPDDAPLCEPDRVRWFNALFINGAASNIVFCPRCKAD